MIWPRSCKAQVMLMGFIIPIFFVNTFALFVIPAEAGIHSYFAVSMDPRRSLPSTPIGGGDDKEGSGDDKRSDGRDNRLSPQDENNPYPEKCTQTLKQESQMLRYDVIYSLYASRSCEVDSIVWVMKAAAYYSYQAHEREKASRFLDWIKSYYNERDRLYAVVYLLQTSNFSIADIQSIIESFSIVIYKKAAYLELISYYPFPSLIDNFVRWRKQHPGIPWTDMDQLVQYTHRLLFTKNISKQTATDLLKSCVSLSESAPSVKFWKQACAYHALRRAPAVADLAGPLLDQGVASGVFQIIHRIKDQRVFRWISY